MNTLLYFSDRLSRFLAYLSGALIFVIAALQISEILSRNLFNTSLSIVWEVAAYLHIAAIFLAAAFTLRSGGHIRVTLFQSLHPRAFEVVGTFVGLAISVFLSYALVKFAWNYGVTGRTSGTTNDIPLVYPAAIVAFGSVMLSIQLALRLCQAMLGRAVEIEDHAVSLSAD